MLTRRWRRRGGGDERGGDLQSGHHHDDVVVTIVLWSPFRVFEHHHYFRGTANRSRDVGVCFHGDTFDECGPQQHTVLGSSGCVWRVCSYWRWHFVFFVSTVMFRLYDTDGNGSLDSSVIISALILFKREKSTLVAHQNMILIKPKVIRPKVQTHKHFIYYPMRLLRIGIITIEEFKSSFIINSIKLIKDAWTELNNNKT